MPFSQITSGFGLPPHALAGLELVDYGLPEAEVARLRPAGGVVHGQSRNFDYARLYGVHQAEVAHQPWEGLAFGMAAAADVEGRGGEIDAEPYARGLVDLVQALHPYRRLLVLRAGLSPLLR